jgi:hypothetical protein
LTIENYDAALQTAALRRQICDQTGNVHKSNTGERSCSHFCRAKAMIITYSEGDFAAIGIQNAMRMRHIVIYGLPL